MQVRVVKPRQQTFYSKKYQSKLPPIGSKQPVDEGISDVSMGVLCCKTETGLSYRGRWKRKPVAVKVTTESFRPHSDLCSWSSVTFVLKTGCSHNQLPYSTIVQACNGT